MQEYRIGLAALARGYSLCCHGNSGEEEEEEGMQVYPEGEHLHWSMSPPQAQTRITHWEEIWVGNEPDSRTGITIFLFIYFYLFVLNTNLSSQSFILLILREDEEVAASMFSFIIINLKLFLFWGIFFFFYFVWELN